MVGYIDFDFFVFSLASQSGSKNALAKNRGSTPSKGKCLGNDVFFLCFEYFDLFFCFSVMVGYIDVDFFCIFFSVSKLRPFTFT